MQQDCSVVLWEHPEWELITHYLYFLIYLFFTCGLVQWRFPWKSEKDAMKLLKSALLVNLTTAGCNRGNAKEACCRNSQSLDDCLLLMKVCPFMTLHKTAPCSSLHKKVVLLLKLTTYLQWGNKYLIPWLTYRFAHLQLNEQSLIFMLVLSYGGRKILCGQTLFSKNTSRAHGKPFLAAGQQGCTHL